MFACASELSGMVLHCAVFFLDYTVLFRALQDSLYILITVLSIRKSPLFIRR